MDEASSNNYRKNSVYRVRFLAAVVVAEIIMLMVIKLWPVPAQPDQSLKERDFSEEVIQLEDAVITRQTSGPPPPPKPTAPIPEPADEIIEEEITELDDIQFSEITDSLSSELLRGQGSEAGPIAGSPQQPPRIIRIVEPTTPDAAQQANIKAELTVRMLVGTDGRVEDASIEKIRLYERPGSREFRIVENIGYGIAETTLDAAMQWRFQPARSNGEPVRTYSRQIFTYGF